MMHFLKETTLTYSVFYIQVLMNEIRSGTDLQDAMWNLSRHENTYVNNMIDAREEVKGKMQVANNLYREMKKKGAVPLSKQERDKVLKP